MTPADMEPVIKNLDLRLTHVEQILPILATKEDLRLTEERLHTVIAGLATRDELRLTEERLNTVIAGLATKDELGEAVRGLATKDELREAVRNLATREDVADARRYALVLYEDLKSDIRLIAEHLARLLQRLDERR